MLFHRRKRDRRKPPSNRFENYVAMAIVLLVCAVWVLFLVELAARLGS